MIFHAGQAGQILGDPWWGCARQLGSIEVITFGQRMAGPTPPICDLSPGVALPDCGRCSRKRHDAKAQGQDHLAGDDSGRNRPTSCSGYVTPTGCVTRFILIILSFATSGLTDNYLR